jgi:hypothetical protein
VDPSQSQAFGPLPHLREGAETVRVVSAYL